jgi:hypothetical protein
MLLKCCFAVIVPLYSDSAFDKCAIITQCVYSSAMSLPCSSDRQLRYTVTGLQNLNFLTVPLPMLLAVRLLQAQ